MSEKRAVLERRDQCQGYAVVQVDHEVCIRCGVCYTVCPDYVFEIREGE